MKANRKQEAASRRKFLRDTAAVGAGAAAIAAAPQLAMADQENIEQETQRKGYRLTPHIAQYYKTAAE